MDYEKIVEQRRRNWDALKPEDIRRAEKEAERAARLAEKEKSGKPTGGFHSTRKRLREEADKQEVEQYRRTMKQVYVLVGLFVLLVGIVLGVERLNSMRREAAFRQRIETYALSVNEGKHIDDLSDPIGGLATWRSAWMTGDMQKLIAVYSPSYFDQMAGNSTYDRLLAEHRRLYRSGAFESSVQMASAFDYPELVRIPRRPWRDKELAIFRSPYILRQGDQPPGVRFIAAFSWDSRSSEWRFADAREEQYFSIRWTSEPMITAMRMGPNAPRFDEHGNRIERER